MAIPRTGGQSNGVVEYVYNPQAQFHPTHLEVNEERGAFSTLPFQSNKCQKQQRVFVYEENPLPREQERVLMQVIPGQDGRQRIVEPTKWPHRIIAQVSMVFNGQKYGGSGSLVGPHHVLTCGHNVYDTDQNIWAEEMTVHPALDENHAPFGSIKVVKVYTFTQYINQKDEKYDIALLILSQSIGKYTGWSGLLSAPDHRLSQAQVSIVGYPGDKGTKQMWGMKHTIQKIEPDLFQYLIDTNKGQSGSGIWIDEFALPMVIGVHIQGDNHVNLGVRLSRDKFEVLVAKIEETFKRKKVLVSPANPTPVIFQQTQLALPQIAFGKAKWARYFGNIGVEPPLPPNIHEILNAPCPFWPGKHVHETHLLTLIPRTVNRKPFTLDRLRKLVQNPRNSVRTTEYRDYLDKIQREHGSTVLPASYWVFLTKGVIPSGGDKTYDAQRQLLATYNQKSNLTYEVPTLLEAATSILMEHVQNGTRLYNDTPWTYTYCQERLWKHPEWPLVVGGFASKGLGIHDGIYDIDPNSIIGVGGSLKL